MAIDNILPTDTFNTLLNSVNDIIDRLNQIDVSTINEGGGISVLQTTNGDTTIDINLCSSSGLFIGTDNCLHLDFNNLTSITTAQQIDTYAIQTSTGIKKIKSENMLPLIIKGDHIFYSVNANSYISFETDYLLLNSNNVVLKNPYLYLNYNIDTNNNFENNQNIDSGLKIISEDAGEIKFVYDGQSSTWLTNKNLGFVGTENRFLSKTSTAWTNFTFGLLNTQVYNLLRIQQDSSKYWEIYTNPYSSSLNFAVNGTTDSEDEVIFKIYKNNEYSTLHISERIIIGDIQNSNQFNATNSFSSYRVPLSTTNGVLDYKWVNRFVTQNVLGTVLVGDVVRISTDTDSYVITRADNTTELRSEAIGIVERINSGKYYVVLSGEFNINDSFVTLVQGDTYYLSSTPGQVTTTKPSTIVKPILIATGSKTGILLNSAQSQTPIYKNIYLVDEDVTLTPSEVNDTLAIKAGVGIAITQNSSNELEIYASGGAGTQNTFASVNEISALHTNDNLRIVGGNGITIQTIQDETFEIGQPFSTQVSIYAPNSFGVFEFTTDNTDQEQFTIESATSNSTFVFNAGVGIRFDRDTNDVVTITATGDAQPANRSVDNAQLALMTANSVKVSNAFGEPTNLQIPDEGIIGRFRDDYNNLSNIISLTPSDIRKLIDAADEGTLEENQNAFSAVEVEYNSNVNLIEATQKTDTIRFKAGTGIILQGEEQTDGDKIVTVSLNSAYFTSYVSGFTTVHLPDHTFTSGTTGSILTFSETSTILPHTVNTNNTDVGFNIKPSSITNYYMADMPFNSIKGNNDNTDGSVTDIEIQENNLFGRPTGGFIKSLTGAEARTILGLTSSVYYKSASINYSGITTQLPATTGNETLKFVAGTNIQLSTNAANQIVISAQGGTQQYGVKEVRINNESSSFPNVLSISSPTLVGSTTYKNIALSKTYDSLTNTYSLSIDLGAMPANSVKIASTTLKDSVAGNYLPTNLVLGTNSVVGRFGGNVTSIPLNLLTGFLGIKTFNKIEFDNVVTPTPSSSSSTSSSSGALSSSSGALSSSSSGGTSSSSAAALVANSGSTTAQTLNSKFKLIGTKGVVITGTNLDGIYGTPTFTFSAEMDSLFADKTPKLGGNLDMNGYAIVSNSSLYFKNNSKNAITINGNTGYNTTLNLTAGVDYSEISVSKFAGFTTVGNLKLTPAGSSSVIITNGKLTSDTSDMSITANDRIIIASRNGSTARISTSQNMVMTSLYSIGFKIDSVLSSGINDLAITKPAADEVMLSSYNNLNLVFAANTTGGVSDKNIIFKGNVKFDVNYNIISDVNIVGTLKLKTDPEASLPTVVGEALLNRGGVLTPVNTTSYIIDSFNTAYTGLVYNVVITDNSNNTIKKLYTIKILNSGTGDMQILTTNDLSSIPAKNNIEINRLSFACIYTSGIGSVLTLENITLGKRYSVSFSKVSFN